MLKKWALYTVAALLWLSGLAFAARPGDPAPPWVLTSLAGGQVQLQSLLASGPVVVWFPAVTADSIGSAAGLQSVASQHGARLVVIPVVAGDTAQAQQIAAQVPGALVLLDPDGSVTLGYTGEFIPGVVPNPNLFVLSPNGTVQAARQFPGLPPDSLGDLLSKAR